MATYPELRGKRAVVTGGSTGIGEAIARAFATQGIDVAVLGGRRAADAERVAADLRALGTRSFALVGDLSRAAEAERVIGEATERLGRVEILVNAAGGFPARAGVTEIAEGDWDAVMDSNVKTTFLCTKAVLPGMVERRWGRIINIASEAGRMPVNTTAAHYAASKAAVIGFTRHVAREVAEYGVTVNATAPSTTYSPRVRRILPPDIEARMISLAPIGRLAEPEEQAGIVVFLASDEARYITGATVDVAGGKVML